MQRRAVQFLNTHRLVYHAKYWTFVWIKHAEPADPKETKSLRSPWVMTSNCCRYLYPLTIGWEAGHTLDLSPANHIHIWGQLRGTNQPNMVILVLVNLLHDEHIQAPCKSSVGQDSNLRTFLLRGNSVKDFVTLQLYLGTQKKYFLKAGCLKKRIITYLLNPLPLLCSILLYSKWHSYIDRSTD